ncbi:MAG: saccharopine dehydrogenase NADP-binding domain-containing protein [Bacteroidota bacterium]
MEHSNWMIYGAYGFTGKLIVEEAVRRGHSPILAGRSAEKLAPIAERFGLRSIAVDLEDATQLRSAVADLDLVLHAAGPFVHTSTRMIKACIAGGTDYLDISGEVSVFESTFARHREAVAAGVALISGVGFDVVPTDCLAAELAKRMPEAVELELGIDALTTPSAGTLRSSIESAHLGGMVRRNGMLLPVRFGRGAIVERFPLGERTLLPLPLGDLVTAYRSTGIPNIDTYLAVPPMLATTMGVIGPAMISLMKLPAARGIARMVVGMSASGPDEATRASEHAYIFGRVKDESGATLTMILRTAEAYRFTAMSAVLAVERTLSSNLQGSYSPAMAFGPGFVMEIDGSAIVTEKHA